MNLLVLSTWFPYPPDNGSKIRAYYLIKALSEAHQVTVVAFRPPDTPPQAMAAPPDQIQVYPIAADPFLHATQPTWMKFVSPRPVIYWPNRVMQQTLRELVATNQWDGVIAIQGPAAPYALTFKHLPRILDVDTALSFQMRVRHGNQWSPGRSPRTWVSWQKAHLYERALFRKFHVCCVAGRMETAYLQSLVHGTRCRVEIVANGVDCQYNQSGNSPIQADSLVYSGAMTYSANFDAVQFFLADIYPQIKSEIPAVSLTVTGSTKGVDTTRLRLDSSVHLSGYVDDIRPLVGGTTICVVPIRQGSGTRLKILEAMALGTPIVATTKGAEGLEAKHGEHLLLADDAASFAECTLGLMRDPDLRQRLAANARRLVEEHYDWTSIGQRFTGLVEDAIKRQTAQS
jgi:glycosyltransferase involved in cell wall biosynthesis